MLHRVWPGTQRLLLWGDPVYAAQMGRAFSGCGADGVEFMEPLSFKGRKGSGLPGGRDAYRDTTLRAAGGDWRKYEYTYRLWGRLAYRPDSDPGSWRRKLKSDHGDAAEAIESGLARASRILPLVSSVHCPSAANNNYWPEMYSDMSLVDAAHPGSYPDTPAPKVFGAVSSLDPQLFATVDECADALLRGEPLARVTPVEVAHQLGEWAESATSALARADALARDKSDPRPPPRRDRRRDRRRGRPLLRAQAARLRAPRDLRPHRGRARPRGRARAVPLGARRLGRARARAGAGLRP